MMYALMLLLAIALSTGFMALTGYEAKRGGMRLFEGYRSRLDKEVSRIVFIIEHVDFAAFFRDMVRMGSERIAHDLATWSLLAVRSLERLLTRAVKYLRGRRGLVQSIPAAQGSAFVETLTDFKTSLRNSRRPVAEVTTRQAMG